MFNLNDADFLKLWEVLRKKKLLFIIRFGCIMLGMSTCLIYLVISMALFGDPPFTLERILIKMIVFMIVGGVMGLLYYNGYEKRFEKLLAN